MSNEQSRYTTAAEEQQENVVTSQGNSTVVSLALFVVLFGLFAAGLYVLSLGSAATFVGGLCMSMLALFITWELIPRFMK
jgi:hypothetical protein